MFVAIFKSIGYNFSSIQLCIHHAVMGIIVLLHVESEIEMCCVAHAGGFEGGGAVYFKFAGGGQYSTTSNTTVALTNCTMTDNLATGVCFCVCKHWDL